MSLSLGDEVYVNQSFGVELDPPVRGRIVTVAGGRLIPRLRYGVRTDDGYLWKAAESWLAPVVIVIEEPASLLD